MSLDPLQTKAPTPKSDAPAPSPLHDALAALETAVETPVVSGESDAWFARVAAALADVKELYANEARQVFVPLVEQIEQNDPELLPKASDLRQQQETLATKLDQLAGSVLALDDHAPDAPGGETSVDMLIPDLVKEALTTVIGIRTLATATATWHSEAMLRDRGVGD